MNIPLAALIAFIGLFVTARFQRVHWLRSTREEIRVRETKEATDLVSDIATTFDKRIVAQRFLLLNLGAHVADKFKEEYHSAVKSYSERFNDIRYRLNYYTSYQNVLDFESDLHDRLVRHGYRTVEIASEAKIDAEEISCLNKELSVISTHVFEYCARFSRQIANEDIGSLRRINDWKDPNNEFITTWSLLKRLLNI